jgi:hypothetical protein
MGVEMTSRITLFVLALASISRPCLGQSAAEVASQCRPIVTAEIRDSLIHFPQSFDTGFCWGAFTSIQKAIVLADSSGPLLRVCAPPHSTLEQLIAIFVRYVDTHPESSHLNYFQQAVLGLQHAFPCPAR